MDTGINGLAEELTLSDTRWGLLSEDFERTKRLIRVMRMAADRAEQSLSKSSETDSFPERDAAVLHSLKEVNWHLTDICQELEHLIERRLHL